jgi:murein DD-endopeptidase MepM/ murein hydrolase activator NlpD
MVALAMVASCIILLLLIDNVASVLLGPRGEGLLLWALGEESARESLVVSQREACIGAPFILPAEGFIGLPYASSGGPYSRANRHQGIDVFSPDRKTPGLVPVYAAYDGYVTRKDDWRSTLIQRVPDDPLQPGRQIWLYYTHMADSEGDDFIVDTFPPGAREVFVEQGTLLGYTGDYNGNSPRGIWVHLHFSIVKDDGTGRYLNELEFDNTLDPSPYLGMPVNDSCAPTVPSCGPVDECT